MQLKQNNIKLLILAPLVMILLILLGTFVLSIYIIQQKDIKVEISKDREAVQKALHEKTVNDAEEMTTLLKLILSDKELKNEFVAKSRENILERTQPLFNELQAKHNITHFYFTNPDRVNLLRVHKTDRYGDVIDRYTTLRAEETGETSYGLELGPLGTFTLRVVTPWYDKDKLLGYVELGKEIDHLTDEIEELLGVNLYVFVYKKYIDRKKWESGMKMLKRDSDWQQFSNVILLNRTIKSIPRGIVEVISEEHHARESIHLKESEEGFVYYAGYLTLSDAGDRRVGAMAVLKDVTQKTRDMHKTIILVALVCYLAGGGLFTFFYVFIDKVQNRLQSAQDEIETNYDIQKTVNAILQLSLQPLSLKEQLSETLKLIFSVPWFSLKKQGCIFLTENDKPGLLTMKAYESLPEDNLNVCLHVPFGKCICGKAASEQKIVFTNSIDEHHEFSYRDMSPHGHYCVPILSESKLLGVITLYLNEGHLRRRREDVFLNSIAHTLAGIILRRQAEESGILAEKELEEKRVLSIHSDRLRSLGEMATGIAHELNQPLVGVRGLAEHLLIAIDRKWDFTEEKIRNKLQLIVDQADRMSYIIEHVRMFAREAGKQELYSVQVNDVVNSAVSLLGTQLQNRGIDFKTDLQDNLPDVKANPFSMEEVILNLIINARDAIEERMTSDKPFDTPLIVIRTFPAREGQEVTIELEDSGAGIPDDIFESVFDPFFTTKGPERGTGLGLSISKSIIEGFGGRIDISKGVDKGTVVTLTLPALSKKKEHH